MSNTKSAKKFRTVGIRSCKKVNRQDLRRILNVQPPSIIPKIWQSSFCGNDEMLESLLKLSDSQLTLGLKTVGWSFEVHEKK